MLMVLSCWQGQQGYNLSPPSPDEPADEWHITANAPCVVWEMRPRWNAMCSLHRVDHLNVRFLQQCERTLKESWTLFIAVRHLPVSLLEFRFMGEERSLLCAILTLPVRQGERVALWWSSAGFCKRCKQGTMTHTLYLYPETSCLLSRKMQRDLCLWAKVLPPGGSCVG